MSVEDVGEPKSATFWKGQWESGFFTFHFSEPQPNLVKFYESAFATKTRIFLPLCGKTVDMIWLEERGHDVVGLELSEVAVKMFFEDNGMEYEEEIQGKFQVFKAKGRNVTIFCGDIFDANRDVLGLFDAIWDRGAFTSMHPIGDDRQRYLNIMKSIARDDKLAYLVNVIEHYCGHKGPPYRITYDEFEQVARGLFDVNVLLRDHAKAPKISAEPVPQVLYELTIKTK